MISNNLFKNLIHQIKFYSKKKFTTYQEKNKFFIKFNRPEKRNCLNIESFINLNQLINQLNEKKDVDYIILNGEGSNFCSGLDLSEFKFDKQQDLLDLYKLNLFDCKKILISIVNGFAVGLGFELILASDLVLADQTSKFGFLNRRFGIPVVSNNLFKLKNLLGISRALELICTSRILNIEEAHNLKIVDFLIEDGENIEIKINNLLNNHVLNEIIAKKKSNLNIRLNYLNEVYLNNVPEDWVNHKLNSNNYNVTLRNHGKFDLSFYDKLNNIKS